MVCHRSLGGCPRDIKTKANRGIPCALRCLNLNPHIRPTLSSKRGYQAFELPFAHVYVINIVVRVPCPYCANTHWLQISPSMPYASSTSQPCLLFQGFDGIDKGTVRCSRLASQFLLRHLTHGTFVGPVATKGNESSREKQTPGACTVQYRWPSQNAIIFKSGRVTPH